jgi:hypothetical protein
MANTEKLEMLKVVRKHILNNPKIPYAQLVAELKVPRLSTVQFYNIKAQLRKKGQLVDRGETNPVSRSKANETASGGKSMRIEILDSIDIANLPEEIKEHYKTNIFDMLRRLVPDGKNLRMVFLSDPPTLEIQRIVT